MSAFTGFSRDFPQFLFELPFENTIEKQAEHVAAYKEMLLEPLKLLYGDLLPLMESFETLETLPRRCICSPYTDRRFSPTEPLKDYVYLKFRQSDRTEDRVGLYFEMGCEAYAYGLRFYRKTPAGMKARREAIAENSDAYLKILPPILKSGFSIVGERYKKDHCPDLSDPLLKELLNHKYFSLSITKPLDETVFTPALSEVLAEGFTTLRPMLELTSGQTI